jgi:NAD-dependent SIR2 family protein deacetylase
MWVSQHMFQFSCIECEASIKAQDWMKANYVSLKYELCSYCQGGLFA